jgi:hypothetical protein
MSQSDVLRMCDILHLYQKRDLFTHAEKEINEIQR